MTPEIDTLLRPLGPSALGLPRLLPALGWQGDIRLLAEALPVLLDGRTFDRVDLMNTLTNLGYEAVPAKDARLPDGAVGMVLGESGEPEIVSEETGWHGKGRHFILTKREKEDVAEAHARVKTGLGWTKHLTQRMGRVFAQVAILSALSTLFALAVPLYVMLTYDKVIGTQASGTLPALTLCAFALLLAEAGCFALRIWAGAWFSARIGQEVGTATFERLLALPALFTERATPASQILRLKSFEAARDFFGGPMLQAVLDAPFVLVLIAVMGIIGGPLAFVPVGLAVAYILLLLALKSRISFAGHKHARAHSERQYLVTESFSRLESIYSGGMRNQWIARFSKVSKKAAQAAMRHHFYSAAVEHGAHALLLVAVVVTLVLGIDRVWNGEMSVGALIATMILIWRVLGPLHTLCALLPRFAHVRQAIVQIDRLMALSPEPAGAEQHAFRHVDSASEISFSTVGLRYGRAQDPVFAGLNATIKPGELVAVTGSNGVGKSSVLKLVQGLYAPVAGQVRLGGADLRQLDPVSLRRRVAYLPQTPQFITGSVLENLRLGRAALTEADAWKALAQADAAAQVESLPQGILTEIHSKARLPAGLAQRLHLARLYLGEEKVLLIDEQPNALLETEAGRRFLDFLRQQRGRRTVLFVTHREDHLRLADRILWLRADAAPAMGKLRNPAPEQERRHA